MEDYLKLIIALSSVLLGWILAQFTGILKDWLYVRKIKKCIIEELYELCSELERTLLIYSRELQIHALKGIGNGSPTPISNHIFNNYYKDAVLDLNKKQRISLQLIHTLVDNINLGIKEFSNVTAELQKMHMLNMGDGINEKDGVYWGSLITSQFINIASAIWHIKFHLKNPKNPDLTPFTHNHELYLKYLDSIDKEMKKFIDAAKTLDKSQFEMIYDPESFAKQFL